MEFAGNSVINANLIRFKAGQSVSGNVFQNCNRIEPSTASFSGNNVNNSTHSGGALLIVPNHEVTDCSFEGNTRATEIQTAGTYSYYALVFYSNTHDVHNSSTGAVTVNASGGSNVATYTNTNGGTTTINNSVTVTFTGLPTGCDVVILTAGTGTILDQVDQHPGTSYTWAYSANPTVDVGFIKPGYVPYYIRGLALGSVDSTIPVSLTADRNYIV
jgi:hypothetical protein